MTQTEVYNVVISARQKDEECQRENAEVYQRMLSAIREYSFGADANSFATTTMAFLNCLKQESPSTYYDMITPIFCDLLETVGLTCVIDGIIRHLHVETDETREELLERIEAALQIAERAQAWLKKLKERTQ
jgi:hypothetical protein